MGMFFSYPIPSFYIVSTATESVSRQVSCALSFNALSEQNVKHPEKHSFSHALKLRFPLIQ